MLFLRPFRALFKTYKPYASVAFERRLAPHVPATFFAVFFSACHLLHAGLPPAHPDETTSLTAAAGVTPMSPQTGESDAQCTSLTTHHVPAGPENLHYSQYEQEAPLFILPDEMLAAIAAHLPLKYIAALSASCRFFWYGLQKKRQTYLAWTHLDAQCQKLLDPHNHTAWPKIYNLLATVPASMHADVLGINGHDGEATLTGLLPRLLSPTLAFTYPHLWQNLLPPRIREGIRLPMPMSHTYIPPSLRPFVGLTQEGWIQGCAQVFQPTPEKVSTALEPVIARCVETIKRVKDTCTIPTCLCASDDDFWRLEDVKATPEGLFYTLEGLRIIFESHTILSFSPLARMRAMTGPITLPLVESVEDHMAQRITACHFSEGAQTVLLALPAIIQLLLSDAAQDALSNAP